jgi:hypothetical protein
MHDCAHGRAPPAVIVAKVEIKIKFTVKVHGHGTYCASYCASYCAAAHRTVERLRDLELNQVHKLSDGLHQ